MNYPKYLIPKRYFRIFSIDELALAKQYYLVRRSRKDEAFDHMGLVKTDSLVSKLNEVPGLSKNLLGGNFKIAHLIFNPSMKVSGYWSEKMKPPRFKDIISQISKFDQVTPIYFLISKIHKQAIPFVKDLNSDKDYRKKLPPQFLQSGVTLTGVTLKCQTEVIHKPTICNFWHVEFCLRDAQTGEIINRDKVSSIDRGRPIEKQKAGTQMADGALELILLTNATSQLGSFDKIPKRIYIKAIYLLFLKFNRLKEWSKTL